LFATLDLTVRSIVLLGNAGGGGRHGRIIRELHELVAAFQSTLTGAKLRRCRTWSTS
jgi:hypothetical protein